MRTDRRARLKWYCDYLPQERLVLDASFLINLLACDVSSQVLQVLPFSCLVEKTVLREISRHPILGRCPKTEIGALEDVGLIEITSMTDEEYERYLSIVQAPLAHRLDSGESATIVVSQSRGLSAVIDENKARTYMKQNMPGVSVISTLKLLISSSVRLGWDELTLKGVVEQARLLSRMGVPREEKSLLQQVLDS